jgi:adenylate cyclase
LADVFLSYARADRHRVAPLVSALESQGLSVWWDPAISPGQEFDRLIAEELAAANAVLVVWTPDSVASRWVRGEARDGADRGILVPVRMGDAVLPIDFRALHTIDLDENDPARHPEFDDVVRAVGTLAARAAQREDSASRAGQTEREARTATSPPVVGGAVGPSDPRVAICVLPFANLSGEPEQQAFSDGIAGDIIIELSRWRRLAVRSRSSSFRYRGATVDVPRIARELDVRFIVEGSVRRIGDRIRINVELIDADTGSQVWSERFDRAQAEIFAVQDRVVQQIVSTLVGRAQGSDVERIRRKPPSSLDAYECVLKGNALSWDEPEGAAEATRLFEQAIAIDPGYAIAHALLSTMRSAEWRDNPGRTEVLDDACALAKRAVDLDDGDSTCHSLLSHACLYRHAFELAAQHARRSVELNPNNPWNMADYGLTLMYLGEPEEALRWFESAKSVDPYFDPPWYWRQAGQTQMVLKRHEAALSMFAHVTRRTPRIAAYMAGCCARLGDTARAKTYVDECLAMKPDFTIRRQMMAEPFRSPADAAYLAETLRLAGLPE